MTFIGLENSRKNIANKKTKSAASKLVCGAVLLVLSASPVLAAKCGNTGGGFNTWLEQTKKEAVKKGIKQRTLDIALKGVSYDASVIKLDRNQKSFKLSLQQFMARRAPPSFVKRGKKIMKQNASLLGKIERRYGVPPEVIVAIWGMETGFGSNSGKKSVVRSLATLAYDCRRSKFFTNEFYAALKIIQRGDMTPAQMRGAWAGEIGQTQFLASNYLKFAVDYDGNGKRDLVRSRADVLASTANYLKAYGWRKGQGYQQGQTNFRVLKKWNAAGVYQKALALFAKQLAS